MHISIFALTKANLCKKFQIGKATHAIQKNKLER